MNFFKKKLKNGITVIFEKRQLPIVALSITNKFGAAFEESKIKGISHFIEHLLFTGTKTRSSSEISREIEKKGGILNAFTAQEATSFWFKLPSEHILSGLNILIDMLLNPLFSPEKFEKEKKVILEEIKMYHDAPQWDIFNKIETNLYESPFGEGIIGNENTISSISREFVVKYYNANYFPSNFIVTIVGNADFDFICNYLEEKISPIKKKDIKREKIIKINKESFEEREGIDQAHFVFAIHAPIPSEENFFALEILDAYLANWMSSKLFLTIREEKGLAYSVKSSINAEKSYSYYSIYVGTMKEKIDEVKKLILEGFESAANMSEKDFKEAKERVIGLRRISKEESVNVMNDLMSYELAERVEDYYNEETKINAVKLEDVKNLARIKKFSTAAIVPK